MSRAFLDVRFTVQQIERLREQHPELADDAELLMDTLEGQTEFEPIIERVTEEFLDAVSMKEAIAIRRQALKEREDRFDAKADAMRDLALTMMEAANVPTVRLPQATLSLRPGVASVEVTDADALPQGMFATERKPLKTEIKKALEAGDDVPGARLQPGQPGLTIRTK